MNKEFFKIIGFVVVIGAVIGSALYYNSYKLKHKKLPYYSVNMYSDEYISSDTPPEKKVGDFNFINQKGEPINQEKIGKSIYVADYIFTTCPGICKIMTSKMTKVYATFKEEPDFKILSHTSKPEEDSIPILMKYAIANGADNASKWMFLTGDKTKLQQMAYKEYGIINPDDIKEEGSFVHTEMLVLVDKEKYIRGYYDGTDSIEVEMLINDIHSLLNE